MGKRYKAGNVGKQRNKPRVLYYRREKEINRLINLFKKSYYTLRYLNDINNYFLMYQLKDNIKQLFYNQENMITTQSFKRRNIYYKQLSRFKRIYTRWKRDTRYAFFSYICHVPPYLFMQYL